MPLLTENQLTDIVDMIVDDYGVIPPVTGSSNPRRPHPFSGNCSQHPATVGPGAQDIDRLVGR